MATVETLKAETCRQHRCDALATHIVRDEFGNYCGSFCYDHAAEKAATMSKYEQLSLKAALSREHATPNE